MELGNAVIMTATINCTSVTIAALSHPRRRCRGRFRRRRRCC